MMHPRLHMFPLLVNTRCTASCRQCAISGGIVCGCTQTGALPASTSAAGHTNEREAREAEAEAEAVSTDDDDDDNDEGTTISEARPAPSTISSTADSRQVEVCNMRPSWTSPRSSARLYTSALTSDRDSRDPLSVSVSS